MRTQFLEVIQRPLVSRKKFAARMHFTIRASLNPFRCYLHSVGRGFRYESLSLLEYPSLILSRQLPTCLSDAKPCNFRRLQPNQCWESVAYAKD